MAVSERKQQRLRNLLNSASYRRADQDLAFLNADEVRPLRLQLELMKAELIQRREHIRSTIVVFGSARIPEPAISNRRLNEANKRLVGKPHDAARQRAVALAKRQVTMSRYYNEARAFGRLVTCKYQSKRGCDYVVVNRRRPGHHGSGQSRRRRCQGEVHRPEYFASTRTATESLYYPRAVFSVPLFCAAQDAFLIAGKGARRLSGRVWDMR